MLDLNELMRLLGEQETGITDAGEDTAGLARSYWNVLSSLRGDVDRLSGVLPPRSGARPLESVPDGFFIRMEEKWADRRECLEWASGVLEGTSVLSVDGGQVYPDTDRSVPVGVVQAGWALSRGGRELDTGSSLEVLGPVRFGDLRFHGQSVRNLTDSVRFRSECSTAVRLLGQKGVSHIIMDYPLLVPNLLGYRESFRNNYLDSVIGLLRASRARSCGLCGFTDRSVASDLVKMVMHASRVLDGAEALPPPGFLTDARLLHGRAPWGSRTPVMLLDRGDSMVPDGPSSLDLYEEFSDGLCFIYLCCGRDHFSRVEFPRYVHDEGLLDGLVSVILAQTAIMGDHPDILIRAHRAASITRGEEELISRLIDGFLRGSEGGLRTPAKDFHKENTRGRRRRTP